MKRDNTVISSKDISSWVNTYSDELYAWSFYKTKLREVSEDLVQDTFLAAIQNKEKFRAESNHKTWLFSILNNKISDYFRKNYKQNQCFTDDNDGLHTHFTSAGKWIDSESPEFWQEDTELLDDDSFRSVLEKCLAGLPKKWNDSLLYKYILEKSAHEICQELNITMTNYWQLIHRSKLNMKKCIERNYFKNV